MSAWCISTNHGSSPKYRYCCCKFLGRNSTGAASQLSFHWQACQLSLLLPSSKAGHHHFRSFFWIIWVFQRGLDETMTCFCSLPQPLLFPILLVPSQFTRPTCSSTNVVMELLTVLAFRCFWQLDNREEKSAHFLHTIYLHFPSAKTGKTEKNAGDFAYGSTH